jgi:radical SAM superfamily enzyme YgiQ (UPF0313 family)
MKKILLVNPAMRTQLLEKVRVLALPPLNLIMLGAYTPEDFEVQILDEAFDAIDFDQDVDLVGITCMTPLAPRAYEISAEFRRRGVPVVLGGIHASMVPEEAARFADCVVVGEGEELWPQLLADFEAGRLLGRYVAPSLPELENLLPARRGLLKNKYFVQTLQTSRGCPHNCKFCSVTRFNGGRYRLRDITQVVAEVESLPDKRLFIIDDNIIGSGERCIQRAFQLFHELEPLKKEWGGQTCLNIVEHEGLLRAAARSGARAFLIGFESIQDETLIRLNKKMNLRPTVRNFKESIHKIQDHGIAIIGGFMFGTDLDTLDTFRTTLDFIFESGIDAVQLSIQTPLPGTALYRELETENRLLLTNYPDDWEAYNVFEPVFQPKQMAPDALYQGLIDAYRQVASMRRALPRGLKTFWRTKSLFPTGISFFWNYDSYRSIKQLTRPRFAAKT